MPRPHSSRRQSLVLRTVAVCLILAFMVGLSAPSGAQENDAVPVPEARANTPANFGYGAASVILTIPYGLAKVLYAAFGGIVGGAALVFSAGDTKAAKAVWNASLHGTYVLTPEHLKGEKEIRFVGMPDDDASAQTASTM